MGRDKILVMGNLSKFWLLGAIPPVPPLPTHTRETLKEIPEFLLNHHKKFVSLVVRSPEIPLKLVERSLDSPSS